MAIRDKIPELLDYIEVSLKYSNILPIILNIIRMTQRDCTMQNGKICRETQVPAVQPF